MSKDSKLKDIANKMTNKKTFVIADTHFSHDNIIKYCLRPFTSVDVMNETLVANWNRVVGKEDTVYFLGDLCFEKPGQSKEYWLGRLNGNIIWIKGNHDHYKGMIESIYFDKYWMVHDPWGTDNAVWGKICIHGHEHNKGKLIDTKHRRICVSAELIDYTPIELKVILDMYEKDKK